MSWTAQSSSFARPMKTAAVPLAAMAIGSPMPKASGSAVRGRASVGDCVFIFMNSHWGGRKRDCDLVRAEVGAPFGDSR